MKTRAGIKDDTSGRATSSLRPPICWSRDRSSPHRGAPPQPRRARGPKRAAADKPRGLSGVATRGSGAHSRGARRAPCHHHLLSRYRPARRVTGATPSGRPGPRAPQPAATSRRGPDSVKLAGLRGARPFGPSRGPQASAPLESFAARRSSGAARATSLPHCTRRDALDLAALSDDGRPARPVRPSSPPSTGRDGRPPCSEDVLWRDGHRRAGKSRLISSSHCGP